MIDLPALALALRGEPLPPLDGEARLAFSGGILTLIHHHGGTSHTLYFERGRGDAFGVTSRAVWGDDIDTLVTVARALVRRYEREQAREIALSVRARMKEKQRP